MEAPFDPKKLREMGEWLRPPTGASEGLKATEVKKLQQLIDGEPEDLWG